MVHMSHVIFQKATIQPKYATIFTENYRILWMAVNCVPDSDEFENWNHSNFVGILLGA